MPRYVLLALAVAVPTGSSAQDFCAALNMTLNQVLEARTAVNEAADSVDDLRYRLSEDRRRYAEDLEDLALPSEDADLARNQLEAAVSSINELRSRRCPSIPDGR